MAIQTLPDGTEYDDSIPCFNATGQRFDPFAVIAEQQLDDEGPTLPFDGDGGTANDDDVFNGVTGND